MTVILYRYRVCAINIYTYYTDIYQYIYIFFFMPYVNIGIQTVLHFIKKNTSMFTLHNNTYHIIYIYIYKMSIFPRRNKQTL